MSIKVKALQKTGPDQPFRIAEIERRQPSGSDILIDIKAAGICHSDIHTIRNEWGQAHFPLTVGHEIAGVVEAIGEEVTKFKVGDRVGVGCLVGSCGHCEECEAGQEQNCLNGNVGTYNSKDYDGSITQGGYSQKITVRENFVLRLPDELDFLSAAPLLCAGITTYSPIATWGVNEGTKVAVVGLGGLGHMGVKIAAAKGADVSVISRSNNKSEQALKLGAKRVLASSEPDFFNQHRGEFDFILNTVSAPYELAAYLKLLAPGGVMVVVGLPPEALEINLGALISGGKVLAGSNIGGIYETQEMLDFCAEHQLTAEVEVIGVHEVDEMYDRVVAGDVHFRAVIDTQSFEEVEV